MEIAVLLTCHNRKDKTIICLNSLFKADLPFNYSLTVFLVDDGSTDGTSEVIKEKFPQINIIEGNGNLYWNRGMHLAWETAKQKKDYDFYLWLNDDIIIESKGLTTIINDAKEKPSSLICGVMQSKNNKGTVTYGGKTLKGLKIVPSGTTQKCQYINGNMVLVPKNIVDDIGILDPMYPHAIGDYEYGLRVIKAGYKCFISSFFTGYCENNPTLPKWCLSNVKFKDRLKSLYSPLGSSHPYYFFIYEYKYYGLFVALKHYMTIHLRVLYPKLWKI
jgi:GT2 family glycosyltransferase